MDLVVRRPAVLRGSPRTDLVSRQGGGGRRLTVLDPPDAATYRTLVGRVAPLIERSLGPAVFANRIAAPPPGLAVREPGDWQLEDWRIAHRRWRRATEPAARGLRLHLDIADCYGSIRPEVVEAALLRLGARPEHRLIRLLHELADHAAGLPVGPPASAVLANAVLERLDRAVSDAGAPHVRWVDDLIIAVRSPRHATQVLDEVRLELGSLELRVQDAKTRLEDTWRHPLPAPSFAPARVR